MIALSNLWCWLRGKPPKWTHFEWGLPFFASMEPAGGEPPPDAAPSVPSSGMAVARLVEAYKVCQERGHTSSGITLTSNPPWSVCKFCGTRYRTETRLIESNVPSGGDPR